MHYPQTSTLTQPKPELLDHTLKRPFSPSLSASSVVSSYGPTSATRDHEKRILESILPPDLRHLVHGSSSSAIHVNIFLELSSLPLHM